MKRFGLLLLYIALIAGANPSVADMADVAALREGSIRKLTLHDTPRPFSDHTVNDETGAARQLSDYRGQIVLLNLWGVWCGPCQAEMPSLDRLQAELGGEDFQVVTVATGYNPLPGIKRFFEEEGIDHLPILLDPKKSVAAEARALSLPVTLILDRDGQEIARMIGDAEWDSDSAKAVIRALVAGGTAG